MHMIKCQVTATVANSQERKLATKKMLQNKARHRSPKPPPQDPAIAELSRDIQSAAKRRHAQSLEPPSVRAMQEPHDRRPRQIHLY
jgi:hypothetical protein